MYSLTVGALEWLRDHHGIIDVATLSRLGVSRRTRLHLAASGTLIPVARGVYQVATHSATLQARCVVACLTYPSGYITSVTGGRLMGLRRMGHDDWVHLATPHGFGRVRLPGVVLHQARLVEDTDHHSRSDGIEIASPWRLAFDLAAVLGPEDHESVVEQILSKRMCELSTLGVTARRLATRNRPGSATFLQTLARRFPGGPLESDPELRVAKVLRDRGIPIVVQATWLELPNGARVRIDISVPHIRWGLEVDVHPDHFLAFGTRDRQRDRMVHRLHWQIDRVTSVDLFDLEALGDELLEVYRARCLELGVECCLTPRNSG